MDARENHFLDEAIKDLEMLIADFKAGKIQEKEKPKNDEEAQDR